MPIEAEFYVEPPCDEGMKMNTNGLCHITKMAAMPIYGEKNQTASFLEPKDRWPWNLVCGIGLLEYYQICSNIDPGLTMTYFTARSNLVPFIFIWENA